MAWSMAKFILESNPLSNSNIYLIHNLSLYIYLLTSSYSRYFLSFKVLKVRFGSKNRNLKYSKKPNVQIELYVFKWSLNFSPNSKAPISLLSMFSYSFRSALWVMRFFLSNSWTKKRRSRSSSSSIFYNYVFHYWLKAWICLSILRFSS